MRRALRFLSALLLALGTISLARAAEPVFPQALQTALDSARDNVVGDPHLTLRYVQQAEGLAKQLTSDRDRRIALAKVRWLGAEANLRTNRGEQAAPLLAEGLKLLEATPEPLKVKGDLLISQGALFMQQERAETALRSFQNAFRAYEQAGERRGEAIALQNMALLYLAANDNARADAYLKQAGQVYGGDPLLTLSLNVNRGSALLTMERYRPAAAQFQAAVNIARQINKPAIEAMVLASLARAQIDLKDFTAARTTLARGFALSTDSPETRRELLASAARLAADQGQYTQAERLIRESFKGVDLRSTTPEFRNAHLYAHDIFRHVGEEGLALMHLEALRRLETETSKVATTTGAALMAARFNYANQQADIERLQRQQVERAAAFQRTLFLSIGGATLVIIVLLSFGLFTIRRSRNQVRAANVVLGETNVALEKALKAKTEFLATTSHEIRTPLNGILGMTQVMLADTKLGEETRDRIGIVHGAGVTMRALVDDILDVAKMETGNLTVEAVPMDLCAVLKDVTRMWQEQAKAKGLSFDLDLAEAPRWIVGDSARLRQIVFNLLSNAIKFTAVGSVGLRACVEGQGEAARLRLVVTDSGIGIPADKFDEIFESFRQVDAGTTRQFGGTGLGLTICRNLAQALGGDISVASHEGQGSAFTVDLPLILADASEQDQNVDEGRAGVMVILDRNPIARSMLRTLFEPRLTALHFAATPDEALDRLGSGGVTHLVIDEATLKAAGDTPMETLQKLGAAAEGASTAILWNKPSDSDASAIHGAGIGKIIEKPITGVALASTLLTDVSEKSEPRPAAPLVSQAA